MSNIMINLNNLESKSIKFVNNQGCKKGLLKQLLEKFSFTSSLIKMKTLSIK